MDKNPLVIDEIDAGKELIKRLHSYAPVKAACWLRADEDGERYLYVVLDGLPVDKRKAYLEVLRIVREMKDHYINPFRVNLIATADPIAKAILEFYHRYPGRPPSRFDGSSIGGVAIGEAYIYPPMSI